MAFSKGFNPVRVSATDMTEEAGTPSALGKRLPEGAERDN